MICPNCGKDMICKNCDYSEPAIWMWSRHDFETEVALLDNVKIYMPELLEKINMTSTVGVYMYKITRPSKHFPQRVIRLPVTIWQSRGNTFARPRNYTELRDSDRWRSKAAYETAHRLGQHG